MNAHLGGFAAAPVKFPVWVMNVAPSNSQDDTLGVIYERGLIGTYQYSCEGFSTYPSIYDLIHASEVFSIRGVNKQVSLVGFSLNSCSLILYL